MSIVLIKTSRSSTSSVNESEKILVADDENTPVISEDSISNQSEVIVKPVHTKKVNDIRVKSTPQYETLFHYFYFVSAQNGWLCKICTCFSHGHSGSRAFIDKPGNLGDHRTE